MKQKSEHRQGSRRECVVPVDRSNGPLDRIRTVDISQEGIGIICDHPMPIDDDIAVQVDLSSRGESVVVWGKIRWVRRIKDTGNYRIGVKFTDEVLRGSQNRLNRFFKKI